MIKTYDDIEVMSYRATASPCNLICDAASQAMFMDPKHSDNPAQLIKNLVNWGHHSVLEHASMTFRITGCSRSFLAQVTRQRTFKFTSSSQHYQNYSKYPMVINKDVTLANRKICADTFVHAKNAYIELLEHGVPKEEARQVLPNACAVNLFITADARNLMYFFQQRRCSRNTAEMIQVADAMWTLCCGWFPELFNIVGPYCVMNGYCNQGGMQSAECRTETNSPDAA